MKFSRWVFLIAGIYGVVCLAPMFFMENAIGEQQPPPITHPEYFYGFVGVGLAWQVLFLLMSRNPSVYRPLIPACVLEKLTFGIAVLVLFSAGRVALAVVAGAVIDLVLAALFVVCYVVLGRPSAGKTS